MGQFQATNNYTALGFESGTYGTAHPGSAAQWIGCVQSCNPEDSETTIYLRYHGTSSRNASKTVPGLRDYKLSIDYYPQDFRMLMFALGNGSDTTTGSPAYYSHVITELEPGTASPMVSGTMSPFTSFQIESKQQYNATGNNFIRTYKGCVVDDITLSMEQGMPLSINTNIVAQDCSFSSGSGTIFGLTEPTTRPYIFSDLVFHYPSGTRYDINTLKMSIANKFNVADAHVANGSLVMSTPQPSTRDSKIVITMPGESTIAAALYGQFKSGGYIESNGGIAITRYNTASGVSWIALSGASIIDFKAPNPIDGIDKWTLTIQPRQINAVIQDQVLKYKAW